MRPQSAKGKGRRLQQYFRDLLIRVLELHVEDVKSTSMGAGGEDITLSHAAHQAFPCSVECKNVERVYVWQTYAQAQSNCGEYEPVCVIKRNHHKPLVVVDAEYFVRLHSHAKEDSEV